MRVTCPANLILFDLVILIILLKSPNREVSCYVVSVTSYHFISLRSKYFSLYPFSNKPGLCPSLNVRDQVSHSYRTTGKSLVIVIVKIKFRLWLMLASKFPQERIRFLSNQIIYIYNLGSGGRCFMITVQIFLFKYLLL
jgi:hypothetical protein